MLRDPAPAIRISGLADSCIVISVMPWVDASAYGVATGEIYQRILEAFRARHIAIPFPQREVRVLSASAYLAGERAQDRLAGRDAA